MTQAYMATDGGLHLFLEHQGDMVPNAVEKWFGKWLEI